MITVWEAVNNFTWMPINVHRMIANVAFGGSVAAAYAAFKFLQAETDEERAHYDWMGYIGNFVAISAFLPLPFAGYWLAKEIYAYSQTLGLTMMGGAFSWLFIIQAVLIGNLFLAANYYLWLGMGRVEGAQPLQRFIKYLLIGDRALLHGLGDAALDHRDGLRDPGDGRIVAPGARLPRRHVGQEHRREHPDPHDVHELPALPPHRARSRRCRGRRRAMRRSSRSSPGVALFVIFLGVYGYFVEATVRIGLSVPQVLSVLFAMVSITAIDVFLFRGASRRARCAGARSRRSRSTC